MGTLGGRKMALCAGVAALALAVSLSGACSRSSHRSITLAGSTAFQPFAEKLAERYLASNPGVQINVQGGGSAVGIQSALSGAAQIGMADLPELPPEARGLAPIIVARDGIAIVVHPGNPVSALTAAQVRDVFSGKIGNWSALGGADAAIHVISREEGSGTRRTFDKLALGGEKIAPGALFQNSNGTVREAVASDPYAVGYVSIGLVNEKVKPVKYDGVEPLNANVKQGTYPLARPIFLLTLGTPAPYVQAFIDYVLSREAQGVLEKEGLIGVK